MAFSISIGNVCHMGNLGLNAGWPQCQLILHGYIILGTSKL